MKSKIITKSPIVWDKELFIQEIRSDLSGNHIERMRQILGAENNEDIIRARVNKIIIDDAKFNVVMHHILSFFDFKIDDKDVEETLKTFGQFDKKDEEAMKNMALNKVKQDLVLAEVAKELKIEVTDKEVDEAIERTKSITKKEKIDSQKEFVKKVMFDQKVTAIMLSKFRFVLV